MIVVRDLCHEYPGRRVLDGVTLTIQDGEYVGLVGHNGSGKSTLLRLIIGLSDLQGGTIEVDGLCPGNHAQRTQIRQKAGLLFQNPDNQIVATIVEDDVAFGPENLGLTTEEIRSRVDRALQRVGLSRLRHQSPVNLSGGQKQRLAIASLLALEPAHLLLDEPLSMLDTAGKDEVQALLRELHRSHRFTVIHATHDLEELSGCDRILALKGGRLVADMPARDFFRREDLLEALQLEASPAMEIARDLVGRGVMKAPERYDREGLLAALGLPVGEGRGVTGVTAGSDDAGSGTGFRLPGAALPETGGGGAAPAKSSPGKTVGASPDTRDGGVEEFSPGREATGAGADAVAASPGMAQGPVALQGSTAGALFPGRAGSPAEQDGRKGSVAGVPGGTAASGEEPGAGDDSFHGAYSPGRMGSEKDREAGRGTAAGAVSPGMSGTEERMAKESSPAAGPPKGETSVTAGGVRIEDLSVVYMAGSPFETRALERVSLGIGRGEFLGLIGTTGSGKTTLLQSLAGLLEVESGRVVYPDSFVMERLWQKVGILFQMPEDQLFEATVHDDIAFGPRRLGWDKEEVERGVLAALQQVGLPPDYLSRSPQELSGGEKRRVAVAGVLAMRPELILLDEPTAGLDAAGRRLMAKVLEDLRVKKVTMVLVSHDLDFMGSLADRIALFHLGRLAAVEPTAAMLGNVELLASAGLEPPFPVQLLASLRDLGHTVDLTAFTSPGAVREIARVMGVGRAEG